MNIFAGTYRQLTIRRSGSACGEKGCGWCSHLQRVNPALAEAMSNMILPSSRHDLADSADYLGACTLRERGATFKRRGGLLLCRIPSIETTAAWRPSTSSTWAG